MIGVLIFFCSFCVLSWAILEYDGGAGAFVISVVISFFLGFVLLGGLLGG